MKGFCLFILVVSDFFIFTDIEKKEKKIVHVVLLKFNDKVDIDLIEKESYKYPVVYTGR